MLKGISKKDRGILLLAGLNFILVTATGIYSGCKIWQMVPLWVSTVIMVMQTKTNRYAFILGGINSIWYAVVYVFQELYASAVYTFFFSSIVQFISFWNWNRHAYKNSVYFKALTRQKRGILGGMLLAGWLIMLAIFSILKSPYLILDNTISLLGICSTILLMLSFVEAYIINIVGCLLTIWVYVLVVGDSPDQLPYLIYSIYSWICVCKSYHTAMTLYKEQQQVKNKSCSEIREGA